MLLGALVLVAGLALLVRRIAGGSLAVVLPTVGLLAGSSLYLLGHAASLGASPSSQPISEPPTSQPKGASALARPPCASQAGAVGEIQALVAQAEAFDRTCNTVLGQVWDAERERSVLLPLPGSTLAGAPFPRPDPSRLSRLSVHSPSPDVRPLLALRQRLADALGALQHQVETAHANLYPLAARSELYALSALYSLDPSPSFAAPDRPSAALSLELRDPTSPTRLALHRTPLRRVRTFAATAAATTPLSAGGVVERFVSPPPPPSRTSSYGHGSADDSLASPAQLGTPTTTTAQFTMMPPRTPRMAKAHGRSSGGGRTLASSSSSSSALARSSWSPAAFASPRATPEGPGSSAAGSVQAGLLPSPSLLSPAPSSSGTSHRARNPSLDETDEDGLPSAWHDDGVPSAGSPSTSTAPAPLSLADAQAAKRAKRRSLQDITYRHASSPLAQLTPRRLPAPLASPLAEAAPALGRRRRSSSTTAVIPPAATGLLDGESAESSPPSRDHLSAHPSAHRVALSHGPAHRLPAHRSARSSFSHSTGRPVFGAHSPIHFGRGGGSSGANGGRLARHRATLSLAASPSVPDLQALAAVDRASQLPTTFDVRLPSTSPATADDDRTPPDSPPLVALSHADLLARFCALHARRRHVLVGLLALRRDLGPDAWAEAGAFVGSLRAAFDDARDDVQRALAVSRLSYGGGFTAASDDDGDATSSFAPPPRTAVEQRRQSLGLLWDGLQSLVGKVGALDDVVETGDGWAPTWLELREDLAELVRVWERSRVEMGLRFDGEGGAALLGQPREPPVRSSADVDATADQNDNDDNDNDDNNNDRPGDSPERPPVDVEDDVSRYLRETAAALPSAGREELFAADSAPAAARRPPSKLTRDERIRLAREHRDETERAVRAASERKGPRGMGDVILELNGLMRVLRRNKGPAAEADDADGRAHEETLLVAVDEPTDPRPQPSPSSSPIDDEPSGAASRRAVASPFVLPLPTARGGRSSLPALSQGSSDDGDLSAEGEGDLLEFLGPHHREGSQVTLRAAESDDDDGTGSQASAAAAAAVAVGDAVGLDPKLAAAAGQ